MLVNLKSRYSEVNESDLGKHTHRIQQGWIRRQPRYFLSSLRSILISVASSAAPAVLPAIKEGTSLFEAGFRENRLRPWGYHIAAEVAQSSEM